MQTFDTSRLRITVNGEAIAPRSFAREAAVPPYSTPAMTKIEFRVESLDAATLDRLCGPRASLPVPLVMHGRRHPKRRRDSSGRLRPMVRDRRLLTMTGVRMSGGVDQPMRVVAECVKRQRRLDERSMRQRHPEWPGWGPGIVARLAGESGMAGKSFFRHDPHVAEMFPNLSEDGPR